MNIIETRNLITEAGKHGHIFTVCFTKKNGDERVMNCRLGVKKHLKGGDSTTAHLDHLITVFDCQKGQYRCINLNTVKWVRSGGKEIKVA